MTALPATSRLTQDILVPRQRINGVCVSVLPELLYQVIDLLIRLEADGREDFGRGGVEKKRQDKARGPLRSMRCAIRVLGLQEVFVHDKSNPCISWRNKQEPRTLHNMMIHLYHVL